jgi:hypothetical protein
MSLAKKANVVNAGMLRAAFGRGHPAKRIARACGVTVATAKFWLSGGIPVARQREIAAEILAELDRQDAEFAHIRDQLGTVAAGGGSGVDFAACALAGAAGKRA